MNPLEHKHLSVAAAEFSMSASSKAALAMGIISHQVRVKHRTVSGKQGMAAVITEGDVMEVRRILKRGDAQVGDVILHLDGDAPFFTNRSIFEANYEKE